MGQLTKRGLEEARKNIGIKEVIGMIILGIFLLCILHAYASFMCKWGNAINKQKQEVVK
jgi:hypothetical protein